MSVRSMILLTLFLSISTAADLRPYSVDDMLKLEGLGKIQFDQTGKTLFFERYGVYENQSDFGRLFFPGETRSKLYLLNLEKKSAPRLLFKQDEQAGYTFSSFSPNGEKLIYDRLGRETGLTKGIVTIGRKKGRGLSLNPDYTAFSDSHWLDDNKAVFSALGEGEVASVIGWFAETRDKVSASWEKMRNGREGTASAIGSGRYMERSGRGEHIVLYEAKTGKSRLLEKGKHGEYTLSPDGSLLASLKEKHLPPDPERALDHSANMGGIQRELMLFTINDPEAVRKLCDDCDVLSDSLQWSPDGRQLAFAARQGDKTWAQAGFYIFDVESGDVREVDAEGRALFINNFGAGLSVQSVWLGRQFVFATQSQGEADTDQGPPRIDWFATSPNGLKKIAADFEEGFPQFIGASAKEVLFIHDGELWAVDGRGHRRNLTEAVDQPVRPWRAPSHFGFIPGKSVQGARNLLLETGGEPTGDNKSLLIVDVSSGKITRIATSSVSAVIAAVSVDSGQMAVIDRTSNVTRLMVVGSDGSSRTVLELNRHLRQVVAGTPTRIDHKGPEGDDRTSWLLLPPGYQSGDRVPTVVSVYPGSSGGAEYRGMKLDDIHALNNQILASAGYAVLKASLPVDYTRVPRNQLDGLVEEVFAAVDAAVDAGYVDPDRLAVMGQSYGGYTTGALVGLTDRFKAAVATAGLYNLISGYGMFDIRRRPEIEREGLVFFGASWAETGQGGMGAPPWKDTERYLKNSPLMYVENIKTPILLMHGDYDFLSISQSEEFFTALSRLGKDAVFVRYAGEGHVYTSPANIRDFWRRTIAWYEEHLGPGYKKKLNNVSPH